MKQGNLFSILNNNIAYTHSVCNKDCIGSKLFKVKYNYENKIYNTIIYASNSKTVDADIMAYIKKVYVGSTVLEVSQLKEE